MSDSSSGASDYSFRDVFEALAGTRSFEDVLDVILATSLRELSADQGSLLLLQGDENGSESLKMLASRGLPLDIANRGYVPRKGSISEYVLRERRPMILNDAPRTTNFESMAGDTGVPRSISSALCVPLIARGTVLGTMNLNRTRGGSQFSELDLEACAIVAGQAAIVIENARLQDELIQKERLAAVGQTVAGISHCIKNILAGVKGGLGLTQMGLDQDNPELLRQGFDLLKRNAGSLGHLVLDLLDYSKEREPMRDVFDVAQTVRDALATVEFKANASKVKLSSSVQGTLSFYGDPDQLFRALLNLVTNAVEACSDQAEMPAPGEVVVSAYTLPKEEVPSATGTASHWLIIRVADNGPGIPEGTRDQIWDLFYSTKGSRGTGIGLAATRKMIEEHEGLIRLETETGKGTTFEILLPLIAEPPRMRRH